VLLGMLLENFCQTYSVTVTVTVIIDSICSISPMYFLLTYLLVSCQFT